MRESPAADYLINIKNYKSFKKRRKNMKQKNMLGKLRYPMAMLSLMTAVIANPVLAFAEGSGGGSVDFSGAATPVVDLINSLLGPVISVVVAVGAVYCVILGVKLAKADEPQEREKAKMALKNAIIGFFLIFILIVVMRLMVPTLVDWVNSNSNGMGDIQVSQ